MKRLLPFLLLTVLLLSSVSLNAQQITFNKVTPPLGSFSGLVGGIAQDNNGFIWIATQIGGLYRYDGYRFKAYLHDPSNKNSLSSTNLETVYADRKGIIWIATYADGIDRLDPATGVFTHFQHNPSEPKSLSSDTVRSIVEDGEGTLWFGTNRGLDRFDPKTRTFQHYQHNPNDPHSLSCNQVREIYEDKEGTLWVGTGSIWAGEGGETGEGGLNRLDKRTGTFTRYAHDSKNPHSLIDNKVQAIYEDSRGTFWVGTAGDGLHTMDRQKGTFERHLYDPARPEGLSRPPIKAGSIRDHITFITEDALGSIWIGTIANGLNRYDPKTQRTVHYGAKDSAVGFTDNSGWTSCRSKDGILWIGTWEVGLYRIDPYHKNIPHVFTGSEVYTLHEDPANNLWIGTTQGLIVKNKKTGTSRKFVNDASNENSLSNNDVSALFQDREGTIWIGTNDGLNRFNARSNSFTRYLNSPEDTNSISPGIIYAIAEAGSDSLWLSTRNSGIDLMDKRSGTCRHFKNNPQDTNSLAKGFVIPLLTDGQGNLWAGLFLGGGLNYLDRKAGRFTHFLKGLSVISLFQDSNGTLWVGTDMGVYKSGKTGADFTKLTDPGSGIENTIAYAIQEDDQKNIWVFTSNGIYRVNPQTAQTTRFGARYGVSAANLHIGGGYKGSDGEIYFGNRNGYYVFSPNELIPNPAPPHVVLTDFRISGKSVIPGKNSPLSEPLERTQKITLRHDQNVIAFDFAAIHFSNPEANRHVFKLENYDPEWREAGAEKTAYYFNVPPGHYVFKVKAASSEGAWVEKAVSIIIHPPWWRTWWAYVLYGLLFIAGVYFMHRYQKRRVIAAERERSRVRELAQAKEIEKAYRELGIKSNQVEQQKEELQGTLENLKATQSQLIQSEKMASLGELTAGIAHEIQNPLNFVNNFSEVNNELLAEMNEEIEKGNYDEVKSIASDIIDNEQKINHHGKRADAIVKGMLQHSRASSGKKEPKDINKLADEYLRLAYHGLRAKDNLFNAIIKTDFDASIGNINIIPQDIGRVILNLITNAFYAVAEKAKQHQVDYEPTVSVSTKKIDGKVLISVKDNGNGIPKKVIDKIFQPFFTTKPTGQGTGLGLSLSYDIVKAHGGELKVETTEGEGAEFIIRLPFA